MKQIFRDKIINLEDTDRFDSKFLFEVFYTKYREPFIEVFYISDLLEKRKNIDLVHMLNDKPSMYSNVYSPKDELEIFQELFEYAIKKNKKIHIIGVTLKEEIELLEKYYEDLGFFNNEVNVFQVDFKIPLITVSVKVENLMWKGSDYKAYREKIFFNPPIRESGQVKAMFKGVNRGVIASIHIENFSEDIRCFLSNCIKNEHFLSIILGKVLNYNLQDIGFTGIYKQFIISY